MPCHAGSFSSGVNLTHASNCTECPVGASCTPGSTKPTLCLPGSYGAGARQQTCELCPAGKFTPDEGATECRNCTAGYLCVKGSSAPVPCPGGTHADKSVLASIGYLSNLTADCIICPAGTSCSVGSSEPAPCLPGSYGADAGQQTCERCPAGKFTSDENSTRCHVCNHGHFCPRGSALPAACPEGTYSNETGLEAPSQCLRTPAGYFSAAGSAAPSKCGGSSLYCIGGLGTPQSISGEVETYTNTSLNTVLDPNDTTTRTSYRTCGHGFYCISGEAIPCPLGRWCTDGVQHKCAAGLLGNATNLDSHICNGNCTLNSYCLEASTAAEPCPDGTVGERAGLKSKDECKPCVREQDLNSRPSRARSSLCQTDSGSLLPRGTRSNPVSIAGRKLVQLWQAVWMQHQLLHSERRPVKGAHGPLCLPSLPNALHHKANGQLHCGRLRMRPRVLSRSIQWQQRYVQALSDGHVMHNLGHVPRIAPCGGRILEAWLPLGGR